MEVGRHFIKQDENGFIAFEQLEPVFFIRGFRAGCPKRTETISFAKLACDFTPEKMIRIVPAVKCGDIGTYEGSCLWNPPAVSFSKFRMSGKKTESDQKVGFTTAHGLFQVKNCLGRRTGQPGKPLADEVLHSLGDVGFFKKVRSIAFG